MTARGNHGRGDRGVALLLALLFVALLSAIVVEFAYEMQVEASLAEVQSGDFEAYIGAKSAIAGGLSLLAGDLVDPELPGGFDSYIDVWAGEAPVQTMNGATIRCRIADEYGKINLNALVPMAEGETAEIPPRNELLIDALTDLLNYRVEMLQLEENPIDAILDWLDQDSDSTEYGAEGDYYSSLEIPYPCKNGRMDSIEELLLIRGVTPELYWGIPPEGMELEEEEQQLPLPDLLTVHGDPMGRINVNTAPRDVLIALFNVWELGNPGQAEQIFERVYEEPYQTVAEVAAMFPQPNQQAAQVANQRAGQPQAAEQALPYRTAEEVLRVSSRVFRLFGDAVAQDVRVRIEAYVWRNPGQMAPDELDGPPEALEAFRILDWRVIR